MQESTWREAAGRERSAVQTFFGLLNTLDLEQSCFSLPDFWVLSAWMASENPSASGQFEKMITKRPNAQTGGESDWIGYHLSEVPFLNAHGKQLLDDHTELILRKALEACSAARSRGMKPFNRLMK
jgi:hypothetical protein